MEYELINPSDKYTFTAPSREVAALTIITLSTMYGAKQNGKDRSQDIPVLILSSEEDIRKWYINSFGRCIEDGAVALKKDIKDSLASFVLGDFNDRELYLSTIDALDSQEKKDAFKEKWQSRRSSLNDIGAYAHGLAKELEEI